MIKSILQGRPLGHPLHPILVHIPIAAFFFSFLADVVRVARGSAVAGDVAFYTMALGLAGALLAAVPGLVDYSSIRKDHPAHKTAIVHMLLNFGAVALYAVNLYLRRGSSNHTGPAYVPFVLSLVGVGVLSYSGYLGGVLVYDDGIAVGRHRRKIGIAPDLTLKPDPTPDGYYPVARKDTMQERQTLRADLGGTVVCVAKVDGDYYAFQEFCTHRFGPLSEGSFHDDCVECPWHRSQFNLKDGSVAAGPAKEPLKVFDILVRDDQVLVRPRVAGRTGVPPHPQAPSIDAPPPGQERIPGRDWKAAEVEEQRRRMEPRVDADGETLQ